MYNWITLLYSRNWHNIVNQLHFNKNKNKKPNQQTKNNSYTTLLAEMGTTDDFSNFKVLSAQSIKS